MIRAVSSTRLLVLGVVRIFQPIHGYDVRRELLSWHLDGWMNTKTGSVYSALKILEKDRLITGTALAGEPGRPERTEYVVTAEGEKEFQKLLRASWWQVQRPAEPLIPALSLMLFMSRGELKSALGARLKQLTAQRDELAFVRASIRDGATGADGDVPEHVREIIDFGGSRINGELEWTRSFLKRLNDGTYSFADEWHMDGSTAPGGNDRCSPEIQLTNSQI